MKLKDIKKIHFIGVGGIGVSAIARMMLLRGKEVIGSDEFQSEITDKLRKYGAKIFYKHDTDNLDKDTDLVVYTIAINSDNSEFRRAVELGIPVISYPKMLGLISKDYYTIAIAGTHGKTTTTGMIAQIVSDSELKPTIVVGSILKNGKDSNFIAGKSKLFITEACEYKRSFLNLSPNVLVITNIDEDHLDYYKDLADIQSAFSELASKLGENDYLICNPNDKNLISVIRNINCIIVDYSFGNRVSKLKVHGKYNMENAKAAFAVAGILKIKEQDALSSLERFEGVWRRFEYRGKTKNGAQVYDDYAHHPTEIRASLCSAREQFPNQKIIVVFQPHLYSRTKLLLDSMAKSFIDADKVLIAPIYAAREKEDSSINSSILANEINKNTQNAKVLNDFDEIKRYLKDKIQKDDIILTMGAGNIYKVADDIINK